MEHRTHYYNYYKKTIGLIKQGKLKCALSLQKEQISELQDWNLMDELRKIEESYHLMLKYFSQGVEDVKRSEVYDLLRVQMITLEQNIKRQCGLKESSNVYYSKLRFVARQSRTMLFYTNRLKMLHQQNLFLSITEENDNEAKATWTNYIEQLFDYIFVTSVFSDDELNELYSLFTDNYLNESEKYWLVSALTLSILYFFDLKKFELLVSITEKQEKQLACRALVGQSLVVMVHRDLLSVKTPYYLFDFKPDISANWSVLQVLYLITSKTKRIRQQMEKDIMPLIFNLQKNMSPEQLQDALGDEEVELPEGVDADMIHKIRNSIQSMTEKANRGVDMYYSSFRNMKIGAFFNEVRNWFKPFSLNTFGNDETMNRFGVMTGNNMLCDSDKYSLVSMFASFPAEIKRQIEEMSSDIKISISRMNSVQNTWQRDVYLKLVSRLKLSVEPNDCLMYASMYLQDVYRFFTIKLCNDKEANPFIDNDDLIMVDNDMVCPRITENDMGHIATEAYNQNLYTQAVSLYGMLQCKRLLSCKEEIILATCCAMLHDYENAVLHFSNSEKDKNELSPELKCLFAACLIKNKDNKHAIKIYKQLYEEKYSEIPLYNFAVALVNEHHVEEAVEILFKEDFLRPDQLRVERLMLSCMLIEKKLEQALPYCEKISGDKNVRPSDFINIGHVYFALKNNVQALICYQNSKASADSVFVFSKEERKILKDLGLSEMSINLMEDAV